MKNKAHKSGILNSTICQILYFLLNIDYNSNHPPYIIPNNCSSLEPIALGEHVTIPYNSVYLQ